ncbi:MAG: HAMP domain-containing sensor histidine kinase [Verrucomicrobiota bacterium]
MNRSLLRWLLFGGCLLLLVGALSLITARSLSLERERTVAAEEARLREQVRLALWRMEAKASAVLVRESARPTRHYQTFPAVDALINGEETNLAAVEVREPSPLLGTTPDLVKLHFQCQLSPPVGASLLCSPQVPLGEERTMALKQYEVAPEIAEAERRMVEMKQLLVHHRDWETVAGFGLMNLGRKTGIVFVKREDGSKATVAAVNAWGTADQVWMETNLIKRPIEQSLEATKAPVKKVAAASAVASSTASFDPGSEEVVGDMNTMWLGEELMLLRQVKGEGNLRMQGAWLDWPQLEKRLLASISDLLPQARLFPIPSEELRNDWRALVTLPVRLEPGPLPASVTAIATPGMRPALALAWICFLATSIATGFILHRTIQLSERRAAFVSAVTHELRTPLTTFRLYSEMLAEGAIPEEKERKSYLQTLCVESDRLTRLVENVLLFSRIERTSSLPKKEQIPINDLVARLRPRLEDRCRQGSLNLTIKRHDDLSEASLETDEMVVEQILFNLVDNADKYAASHSQPREIQWEIAHIRNTWRLTVRDFGPGLSPVAMQTLFQPFCKSASEAADTAPGVGLGLALCRRLARQLGGDLQYAQPEGRGAAFTLLLSD